MAYPDVDYFDDTDLIESIQDVYSQKKRPFIIIIDEWDCIFREYKQDKNAQEAYLDFLRDMLKDRVCIYLVYMTGILPVKKYGTHSALNMFDEFSMLSPGPLAPYVGFTEKEVLELCEKYNELKWDESAQGAIKQIKEKNYCRCLEEYQGNLFLVGINYDRKTKEHQCVIEKWEKLPS